MTDNDMIWTYQLGPINLDLFLVIQDYVFKSKNESRKQLNFAALLKYKKYNFGFGLE